MPAELTEGFNYFQEHAPADEAMDQGTIFVAFIDTLTLDIGTFENVLQIFETTELEPDAREFKYYAPGVGLILVEEDLDEELANPELVFELTDYPLRTGARHGGSAAARVARRSLGSAGASPRPASLIAPRSRAATCGGCRCGSNAAAALCKLDACDTSFRSRCRTRSAR